MGRRRLVLFAVALFFAFAPAALVASAPASASQNWGDWMDQAYDAIESAQLLGPVVNVTDVSAVDHSQLSLPQDGTISVEQRTALVSDGTNQWLVGFTVLGGEQEVIDVIDPSTGDDTTLVLAPQNSDTSSSVHIDQQRHGHGTTNPSPSGESALVAGGCYASPDAPFVIGSVFGPLVKGIGVISCPYGNESLSVIASLYERTGSGSTHVGNNGSASVFGTYLAADAYYSCAASSGHQFQTAQLWSVNGALQSGASSGWATLGCR